MTYYLRYILTYTCHLLPPLHTHLLPPLTPHTQHTPDTHKETIHEATVKEEDGKGVGGALKV